MPESTPKDPYIEPEVIDWLEARFGQAVPEKVLSHAEYCFLSGQQHVVESIKRIAKRQEGELENFS